MITPPALSLPAAVVVVVLSALGGAASPLSQAGPLPEFTFRGVALHPTEPVVVSGHDDGTVRRWDRSSGEQLGPPIRAHDGGVHAVTFDPQGAMIVSGGADGTVRRWEAATGAPHHSRISAAAP